MLYGGFLGCLLWQGVRGAKKAVCGHDAGIARYAFQDFFSFSICLVAPMPWALLVSIWRSFVTPENRMV